MQNKRTKLGAIKLNTNPAIAYGFFRRRGRCTICSGIASGSSENIGSFMRGSGGDIRP